MKLRYEIKHNKLSHSGASLDKGFGLAHHPPNRDNILSWHDGWPQLAESGKHFGHTVTSWRKVHEKQWKLL